MHKFLLSLLLLTSLSISLIGNDDEANDAVREALVLEDQNKFYKAAKLYEKADFLAKSTQLKVNALKSALMNYRKAGLLSKEFDLIEILLNRYPSYTNYNNMVSRMYEIANKYNKGYRDPEFWSLRWIPWLKGVDNTVNMYEKALKRAPFAKEAAGARLSLALKLNDNGKLKEAVKELRILIRDYPKSPERKYAYLALGGLLVHMSENGDGDGQYNREALSTLHEYETLYPDSSEQEYVDKALLKSKDVQAQRLLGVSNFYSRSGRTEAAERYLNLILRDYPDTPAAEESERRLVKIDQTYVPDGFREEVKQRIPVYEKRSMPEEDSKLMLVPENSNGKFLLPIYDLTNKQAPKKEDKENNDKTL